MTDHYEVLGLERSASQDEIAAAFEELLADRRSRRRKASDLHSAIAVVGDPALRKAYDVIRFGEAAADTVGAIGAQARDLVPDIDAHELARQAWQVALKAIVIASGLTARAADATSAVSRAIQITAARRLRSAS